MEEKTPVRLRGKAALRSIQVSLGCFFITSPGVASRICFFCFCFSVFFFSVTSSRESCSGGVLRCEIFLYFVRMLTKSNEERSSEEIMIFLHFWVRVVLVKRV